MNATEFFKETKLMKSAKSLASQMSWDVVCVSHIGHLNVGHFTIQSGGEETEVKSYETLNEVIAYLEGSGCGF